MSRRQDEGNSEKRETRESRSEDKGEANVSTVSHHEIRRGSLRVDGHPDLTV